MEAAPPPVAPPAADYPARFDVEYPERLSHWKVLVKWLLAFPHLIIVYLLQLVASLMVLVAFFAVLFTKKWPRGMFDFMVQIQRWTLNVATYAFTLMRDEYPPFGGEEGEYPLSFQVDYDENLSRWMIFVKWLLVLPHLIILTFLAVAAWVVLIIAWFAILFTGRYPRGMFDFVVGTLRWWIRVQAYAHWLMTDRYPPFSLK
jgi:Domain of unknown function (DUF4389)